MSWTSRSAILAHCSSAAADDRHVGQPVRRRRGVEVRHRRDQTLMRSGDHDRADGGRQRQHDNQQRPSVIWRHRRPAPPLAPPAGAASQAGGDHQGGHTVAQRRRDRTRRHQPADEQDGERRAGEIVGCRPQDLLLSVGLSRGRAASCARAGRPSPAGSRSRERPHVGWLTRRLRRRELRADRRDCSRP